MNICVLSGRVIQVLHQLPSSVWFLLRTCEPDTQTVLVKYSGTVSVGSYVETQGRLVTEPVMIGGALVHTSGGGEILRSVYHAQIVTQVQDERQQPAAPAMPAPRPPPLVPPTVRGALNFQRTQAEEASHGGPDVPWD